MEYFFLKEQHMELIERPLYVEWLKKYRDKPLIKVLTGLRRVGKSKVFELYIDLLRRSGVSEEDIVAVNFEDMDNAPLREKTALYRYVVSKVRPGKRLYVFLDEIQAVPGFEEVVDSLLLKPGLDIYITGSNARFLSSEIATVLTGRYVEINVLPLSFQEYSSYYGRSGKDRRALFRDYYTYGAMPGLTLFELGSKEQEEYIASVYKTILEKDVLKRNSKASRALVEGILGFLMSNVGSLTSPKRMSDYINSNTMKVAYATVASYLDTLEDCYFLYKADRFDLVGKKYLQLINKYYLTDFGFKNYLLGNRTLEIQEILENLVYLELRRRRYKIATGKIGGREVDFVLKDLAGETKYVQVAVTVSDEAKLEQELRPLREAKDNYPKYIITLDEFFAPDHDGIRTINALDFLLGQEL